MTSHCSHCNTLVETITLHGSRVLTAHSLSHTPTVFNDQDFIIRKNVQVSYRWCLGSNKAIAEINKGTTTKELTS